jgi:hypothetical protein
MVLAWAVPALAGQIGNLVQLEVTVTATSSDGSSAASQTFEVPHGIIDADTLQNFVVVSPDSPCCLYSGATELGKITDLELGVQGDPVVKLKFAVTAGDTDTPFTITSAFVPVSPGYTGATGLASGQVGASDDGGDGVTLTGAFPGGKTFEALYNGSSVFGTPLVNSFAAAAYESGNSLENSGWQPIPGTVNVISSQFQFVLSHGDDASGTGTFQVLPAPEPSSLSLAAIGGILALAGRFGWRRRMGQRG